MFNYPVSSVSFNNSFAIAQGGDGGGVPNPLDIFGSSLQLWMDAADTSTITHVANKVTQWNDKSANGDTYTQGTAAKQPTTGSVTLNGNNTISFDGGDLLTGTIGIPSIMTGANTAWIIAKRNTEDASRDAIFSILKTGLSNYLVDFQPTSGMISFRNNNAGTAVTSTGNTNTTFQVIKARRLSNSQFLSVNNGAESTNGSAANNTALAAPFIGALTTTTFFLTGAIAEIIITNQSYSSVSPEQSLMNEYITSKWGIVL